MIGPTAVMRRAALAIGLAAAAIPSHAAAQEVAGEYVLEVAGQRVLALKLEVAADGSLAGTVWRGADSSHVTGIRRGAGAFFVTTSPDGQMLHWEAVPENDGLALTLIATGPDGRPDYAGAEQHRLQRGSVGGAKAGIFSRAIAIADSIVSWCIQAEATESSFCRESIKLLESMRPGLEVARLAAGESPAKPGTPLPPVGAAVSSGADDWSTVLSGRAVQVVSNQGGIQHYITFCRGGRGAVESSDPATGAAETIGMQWHVAGSGAAAELVLRFSDGDDIRLPLRESDPGYIQLGDAVAALEEASCE